MGITFELRARKKRLAEEVRGNGYADDVNDEDHERTGLLDNER